MADQIHRHGLFVGIERIDDNFFLSLKAIGKLTHNDYEIIVPMIESALEGVESPKIKVFVDGTQFQGWEARAAWDDFKLGRRHRKEFDRIAILGNEHWQERVAKIGSWFVSGEVKFFEDEKEALGWLGI